MIDADKLRPALRDAFLFLDRMAGEGLGYDGEGIKLDADDVCLALSEVLGATWEEGPFAFADGATAAILALAEESERMRADAARYQWLRDHSCPPHNFYISVPDEFSGVRYGPSEVDAYIDAAGQAFGAEYGAK